MREDLESYARNWRVEAVDAPPNVGDIIYRYILVGVFYGVGLTAALLVA